MQEACLRGAPSHVNAFAWYMVCERSTWGAGRKLRYTQVKNEEAEAPITCDGHRIHYM